MNTWDWARDIFHESINKIIAFLAGRIRKDTPFEDFVNIVVSRFLSTNLGQPDRPKPMSLYPDYKQNIDRLIKIPGWKVLHDQTYKGFVNLVLYDFYIESGCLYPSIPSGTTVRVNRCIKDEQINILAMTEGIPRGEKVFHQSILCKNVAPNSFCCLVPKLQPTTGYQRSVEGLNYQTLINEKYGIELQGFRIRYVAEVLFTEHNQSIRYKSTWQEVSPLLFPLWEPEGGPLACLIEHKKSGLVAFRVYRTEEEMTPHISGRNRRKPGINTQVTIQSPVLDDQDFREQQREIFSILYRM